MVKIFRPLVVICLLFSIGSTAFAYDFWANNAKLEEGITGEYYHISDTFFDGVYYASYIRDAVDDWNQSVSPTPGNTTSVSFTETSTNSESIADFIIDNYGTTGWNGVANFFSADAEGGYGQINEDGFGPDEDYGYAQLSLNDTYLNDDSASDITATAKHEFGHALGLAHSGVLNSIMYENRDRTTYDVESDDVSGVKALY
ncbi:matrixin family metalloprotease [Jeotgalibacillus proteolyticus]|uniref:matrixin family metalloprotease n=1 Tax=Jeotgalibacillus proteolyticus TaxID=2082395 RepID=UPI003CEF9C43